MKKITRSSWLPPMAYSVMRLLASTLRWTVEDLAGVAEKNREPFIYVFWHNRIFLPTHAYRRLTDHPVAILISHSRDGEFLTGVLRCFNVAAARGSSSRGGSLGFRELIRLVKKDGYDVGLAPDGPRGPKYQFQPGVLALSQLTGRPLVPVTCEISHKKELRSWDAFQIPYLFARAHVCFHAPIFIPPDADEAAVKQYAVQISAQLGR